MSIMNKSVFAAALLGLANLAQAETLAAGAAYGGPAQTVAVCYLYNPGTGPVSVTANQIFREPNVNLALFFDSCGVLAPGSSCGIAANIVNNAAHSCRFIVSPSGAELRGSFEFRNGAGVVLNNVELR